MSGFGIELFLLSLLSKTQGPLVPSLFLQAFMALIFLPLALIWRKRPRPIKKTSMPLVWGGALLLCGLCNTAGLLLYSFGTGRGSTSVVATLTSAYPLLPLLFGLLHLRERPSCLQGAGILFLLIGILLLAVYQST